MAFDNLRKRTCLRRLGGTVLVLSLLSGGHAYPVLGEENAGRAPARQVAQLTSEGDGAAFDRGQDLSATHCTRCHVVEDFNPYGGIGSTPSFKLLLSLGDWEERFVTFFERQPHPVVVRMEGVSPWTEIPSNVVTFDMTADDLDDLMSYVSQMKAKQ